jgi:hypothetical protein
LTNQYFKITDGTNIYVLDCGDNDPLEQSITLREQTNPDETGFRIRYTSKNQFFKLTLTETSNAKSIIVEKLIPPKSLYIMGGPFNENVSNWLLEDAVEMERDADNPFVFYYRGDIRYNPVGDLGGSIKFLVGKSWNENYHPAVTGGDQPLNQAAQMRLGGEDNKWTIPADRSRDGYYEIKVNTSDLTITIEQFIHNIDETPRAIFLTGEAMPCGWSNAAPITMQKIESGVYRWQGAVTSGQFKFLKAKNSWGLCYVATSLDERVVLGKEHNIVYESEYYNGNGNDYKFVMPEAGEYTFTVNLNTMKMLVQKDATVIQNPTDNSKIHFFTEKGKLIIKNDNEQQLQSTVFGIDGRIITRKTFAGSTKIALPKGCYIVLVNSTTGKRVASNRILVY